MSRILLSFGPNPHVSGFVDLDMDQVWTAADRAIFHILLLLLGPGGRSMGTMIFSPQESQT
jgi:hypothetical protein